MIKIDSLEMRREKLCLKFAKSCLRNEKDHAMDRRKNEKFVIRKARTERLQRSAVMHMQRLLNNEDCNNRKIMKAINDIVLVNYDYD